MSEPSLAAQRLAVTAMRARPALTALVPAANIIDRNGRPEVKPCIIVGEAQTVGADIDCVDASDVYLTFHVWTEENTFTMCKSIAGEMRRALKHLGGTQDGFRLDFSYQDSRFLRDPGGLLSHGVVTFNVTAEDTE
ncbi:DUF3168 domain-containing protein [Agrobacterium tumefaciens]|uniref:DUF3168 domain-containing protein n=1 Tax=Agrobacterium tumefaciens TaxID=358 RepID=UPI00224433D1|nr:DUF3168 domain-containing protein [Agrobacterium tumefaciens]MCW8057661.1 DUF3168 domain-containing protein [Agrobacterium tumefaciens]MCW8146941.1 DUF3168 domain-containing protein [Agrobacterium tumefaciens]